MPTGYTADVESGKITDFRTFALRCARAFGPTIMQRDDPLDVLPQERRADDYRRQRVEEARAKVADLAAMSEAEASKRAAADQQQRNAELAASLKRIEVYEARYRAMLEQVEAWTPPTADHQGLKDFMVQQLRDSMSWGNTRDYLKPRARQTGRAWLTEQRERAATDLAYTEKQLREEEERVAFANRWIRALYESLEGAHVA